MSKVYRVIREDEWLSIVEGKGIEAKLPNFPLSMESHIIKMTDATPWISTTKEFFVAFKHAKKGAFDNAVIRIDLELVEEYYDVSTDEELKKYNFKWSRAQNYAKGSREVLIKNYVPAEAIEVVIPAHKYGKLFSFKEVARYDVSSVFVRSHSVKPYCAAARERMNKYAKKANLSKYRMVQIAKTFKLLEFLTRNRQCKWDSSTF
jgi:hypothetical protein